MMSDRFEVAHIRARARIGEDKWALLPVSEREREVTEEMRKMERQEREESY
jgi:hypothetical protein